MRSFKVLLLTLALTANAHALSLPNFGGFLGGLFGSKGNGSSSIQSLVINAGLLYAKSDPRVAVVLAALGINNASDLQGFINGDNNGSNFKDIIVHAAFAYAQENPQYSEWFELVGVKDEPSLKAFLNGKGGKYQNLIFSLALAYAEDNPQYSQWLEELEIEDISDISAILNGDLQGTNLQQLLLNFGLNYLQSNSGYSQYAFLLSFIFGNNTLSSSDPSDIFLGAYDGLPVSEIKLIQKTKKLRIR